MKAYLTATAFLVLVMVPHELIFLKYSTEAGGSIVSFYFYDGSKRF